MGYVPYTWDPSKKSKKKDHLSSSQVTYTWDQKRKGKSLSLPLPLSLSLANNRSAARGRGEDKQDGDTRHYMTGWVVRSTLRDQLRWRGETTTPVSSSGGYGRSMT